MAAEDLTGVSDVGTCSTNGGFGGQEPVLQSDEYWAHVRVLHFRSGREVFDMSVELCSSSGRRSRRAVGADILAQLGVRDGVAAFPFADESEGRLVALLTDTEPVVAASALYALGHLGRGRTIGACTIGERMRQKTFVTRSRTLLVAALTHVSIATLIELVRRHGRRHPKLGDVRSRFSVGSGFSGDSGCPCSTSLGRRR